MNTRSRGGCVDCKRSKVKCDEAHPFCGTCARRRITCHGYAVKDKNKQQKVRRASTAQRQEHATDARRSRSVSTDARPGNSWLPVSPQSPYDVGYQTTSPYDHGGEDDSADSSQLVIRSQNNRRSDLNHMFSMVPLKTVVTIPPGMISPADQSTIEVYFSRHPAELVMGSEFINEMNANVLMVLQRNPQAISDCLCAVGRVYVAEEGNNSMISVLDRRARILANLRGMDEPEKDLEQIVVMLLGLCAMELIDMKSSGLEMTIPALIQNAALLIQHHISTGREVTSLAKYFIRALARQDMIISLTHFRRPMISIDAWLDDDSRQIADRLMGYTATFMPMLAELAVLAENIRGSVQNSWIGEVDRNGEPMNSPSSQSDDILAQRAAHLAARIAAWEPITPKGVSFKASRKFLSQAFCYRAAALLYLHRLLHPPQSSPEADTIALTMAHNVLLYTAGPPDELRMSLWPVFIAACECADLDDRAAVIEVFDAIFKFRKTATAVRTKYFCMERVWRARDEGKDWNWMDLVAKCPGELMPI